MRRLLPVVFFVGACFGQVFPSAAVDDGDLLVHGFRAQALLAQAIDATQTSFIVSALSTFRSNMAVAIDSELVFCATFVSGTFSNCTRGFDGTTAATHTANTLVRGVHAPHHHNALKDEIIALEQYLAVTTHTNLPNDGILYCSDCTEDQTCGSGGSGAWARCNSGTCQCFWGGTTEGRGWVPIEIGRTIASAGEEDFDLPAGTCRALRWYFRSIVITGDDRQIHVRVATNGTFHSGGSDYAYQGRRHTRTSSGNTTDTADGELTIAMQLSNQANEALNGWLTLWDPANNTDYKVFNYWLNYESSFDRTAVIGWGGGTYKGAVSRLTKVRIFYTDSSLGSVNGQAGEIDFYGLDCD